MTIFYHQNKERFVEAIKLTESETGFDPRLIEKDYFCSVILKELFQDQNIPLVFKGGTLLNKVHAGFYRLSEDLDFSINMVEGSSRKDRSTMVKPIKEIVVNLSKKIPSFELTQALKGSNESYQYNAKFAYKSVLTKEQETISFEIGLREEVLEKGVSGLAKTLLNDIFSRKPAIPPFPITGLSLIEAYAEKLRAALTRIKAAIRDLYDVDYAIRRNILDMESPRFLEMVRIKLSSQTTAEIQVSHQRKEIFSQQIMAGLRPVLREKEFVEFNFNDAWEKLISLAKKL